LRPRARLLDGGHGAHRGQRVLLPGARPLPQQGEGGRGRGLGRGVSRKRSGAGCEAGGGACRSGPQHNSTWHAPEGPLGGMIKNWSILTKKNKAPVAPVAGGAWGQARVGGGSRAVALNPPGRAGLGTGLGVPRRPWKSALPFTGGRAHARSASALSRASRSRCRCRASACRWTCSALAPTARSASGMPAAPSGRRREEAGQPLAWA
jgi:hypothetical protein